MSSHFLGIDLGTSGLKAAMVDPASGRMVAHALAEYAPDYPQAGWAEQDPEIWVEAVVTAVHQVLASSQIDPAAVVGIGLAGQMHSTVLLDAAGRSLRPAILWLDQRSAPQVEQLQRRFGQEQLLGWTGNPVFAGLTLPTLCWLQEHAPTIWAQLATVLQPKDYLRYRLTGELNTDYSDASATGLLAVGERKWCSDLLVAAGIPERILPKLSPSTEIVGRLRPGMATRLGLPAGVPVVCGAGDQQAQAVGNGIIRPGLLSCTIGTGGQLFATADRYQPDPELRLHTFCHAVPGRWHWQAATLTAGLALRWLRDQVLGGRYSYSELADAAAAVELGAEGLFFLPYLAGERTPHMDPAARGAFVGLTLRHDWRHLTRAVMEGAVFSLKEGLSLIRELGSVDRVVAAGGGTRHPLWLHLMADVFGLPVIKNHTQEAAAVGVALLAAVGVGICPDLEVACRDTVRWSEQVIEPDTDHHRRYRELFNLYRPLYGQLK